MRTTLDLPDELFREVKAKAALEGTHLKTLLTRYVENGLRESPPLLHQKRRSGLPVIQRRSQQTIPSLTSELQARIEQEEDLAKFRRSLGR
jgi:hypothetical protein